MLEAVQGLLSFLAPYLDQVSDGALYGTIGGLIATALAVMIYLLRWGNLLNNRRKEHEEQIEAGRVEGEAVGLLQRKQEIVQDQRDGVIDRTKKAQGAESSSGRSGSSSGLHQEPDFKDPGSDEAKEK